MANLNNIENGTSNVNIGNVPSNSNEQVIAQALSTFALQVPNTVQSIMKGAINLILVLIIISNIVICGTTIYFFFEIKKETQEMHAVYRKLDDRHLRLTQYVKEHDYKILTKEAR